MLAAGAAGGTLGASGTASAGELDGGALVGSKLELANAGAELGCSEEVSAVGSTLAVRAGGTLTVFGFGRATARGLGRAGLLAAMGALMGASGAEAASSDAGLGALFPAGAGRARG